MGILLVTHKRGIGHPKHDVDDDESRVESRSSDLKCMINKEIISDNFLSPLSMLASYASVFKHVVLNEPDAMGWSVVKLEQCLNSRFTHGSVVISQRR